MKTRINTVISVLFLSALTGCVGSSPSEAEAKKAIESKYPSCDYVSIESFKKVNGIKLSENEYSVDVAYDLKVLPVKDGEKVLKERADKIAKAEANQQVVKELSEKINSEMAAVPRTSPNGTPYSSDEYAATPEYKQIDAKYNFAAFRKQVEDAHTKMIEAYGGSDQGSLISIFATSCKADVNAYNNALNSIYSNAGPSLQDILLKGARRSFTETFHMVKSDNGWIMSR